MARLIRLCPPGVPQHIIQRGNNRQTCFVSDEDFAAYASWLAEAAERYKVHLHAWVLMTNHVHLLVTPQQDLAVSNMMQWIGRHYVRYFNRTYARTGTLWEGRFKSCLVQENNYLFYCYRYIELNPVRATMVKHPAEYRWSSYHANALGLESWLRTPHVLYTELGSTSSERQARYRGLFTADINEKVLSDIRTATNKGLVLGNGKFKDEVAALTGRRVKPQKRGPKPKNG